MKNDYYGDGIKWFVGVVKDVRDPKDANRVRVRIKGIHPEDTLGDSDSSQGENTNTGGGSTGGGSSGGGSSGSSGSASSPAPNNSGGVMHGQVEPDESNLPEPGQFDGKLSKHFTLGQLVINGQDRINAKTQMTKEHVKNLARLAVNVLDPIVEAKGKLHVNSGWRTYGRISNTNNHPRGLAADISVEGMSSYDLCLWIQNNLKGRYNFMINEYSRGTSWTHVQLGGESSQGSVENPKHKTYINGTYYDGLRTRQ